MRLVLDTNTAISGLLWAGPPSQVIDAAIVDTVSLFTSTVLLDELLDVLQRPKLARRLALRGLTASELLAEYTKLTVVVSPTPLPAPVSIDPDDDAVLACAVAAKAEAIVTGDHHLLDLKVFQGIPLLTAPELLVRITPTAPSAP
jgi:putative PIN family toxin of toxin-antitoxin system